MDKRAPHCRGRAKVPSEVGDFVDKVGFDVSSIRIRICVTRFVLSKWKKGKLQPRSAPLLIVCQPHAIAKHFYAASSNLKRRICRLCEACEACEASSMNLALWLQL